MAYNKVILEGRICSDVEMKTTNSGVEYCNFSVAVDRSYKQGEERQTDFIPVKAWRGSAKFISGYFKKGDPILIDGRLEVDKYADKDGNNRTYTSVIVENATFTIGKSNGSQGQSAQPSSGNKLDDLVNAYPNASFAPVASDDDLPF